MTGNIDLTCLSALICRRMESLEGISTIYSLGRNILENMDSLEGIYPTEYKSQTIGQQFGGYKH